MADFRRRSVRVLKLHRGVFLSIKGIYQPIKPFWDPPWPLTPPKKNEVGRTKAQRGLKWKFTTHWTEAKAAVFSIQYVNYFNPIPVGLFPFSFLVEKAPLEAILSVSQSLM